MLSVAPTTDSTCIKHVGSFHELATTPLAHGVNALCWARSLPGDYAEVVRLLGDGHGEPVTTLDEAVLLSLPLSPAGRVAADHMLADLRLLRDHDLDPVLNCIHGYPRDEEPGPIQTDVFPTTPTAPPSRPTLGSALTPARPARACGPPTPAARSTTPRSAPNS